MQYHGGSSIIIARERVDAPWFEVPEPRGYPEIAMFEGMVVFVCIDSDEDTYLMIAAETEVEQWWDDNPDGDRFACANAIGRKLTDAEAAQPCGVSGPHGATGSLTPVKASLAEKGVPFCGRSAVCRQAPDPIDLPAIAA